VLRVIQSLGRKELSTSDAYAFERELEQLHPDNRHVKDKIRQQLQVLRDAGLLVDSLAPARLPEAVLTQSVTHVVRTFVTYVKSPAEKRNCMCQIFAGHHTSLAPPRRLDRGNQSPPCSELRPGKPPSIFDFRFPISSGLVERKELPLPAKQRKF